jgi:hypothetical protein
MNAQLRREAETDRLQQEILLLHEEVRICSRNRILTLEWSTDSATHPLVNSSENSVAVSTLYPLTCQLSG